MSIGLNAQILYECRSSSKDTVVYVLGTCHLLPNQVQIDTALLANLIHTSEVVFSEMYIDDGDTSYQRVKTNLINALRFKNNGVLSDSMTKKDYASVMAFYKLNYGVTTKQFRWSNYYQPWVMHRKLTNSNRTHYSFDNLIYSMAKAKSKRIVNLDNEQGLMKAHEWLNHAYGIQWLLGFTNQVNAKELDEEYLIEKYYLKQDTASIALLRGKGGDTLRQKLVVDDRNRHWQTVIEKHQRGSNFVFGGLAHVMLGEYSLLNYFKTKQYTIKPIRIDIRTLP